MRVFYLERNKNCHRYGMIEYTAKKAKNLRTVASEASNRLALHKLDHYQCFQTAR